MFHISLGKLHTIASNIILSVLALSAARRRLRGGCQDHLKSQLIGYR